MHFLKDGARNITGALRTIYTRTAGNKKPYAFPAPQSLTREQQLQAVSLCLCGEKVMNNRTTPEYINRLSGRVVHAAYKVHEALGPGLLESVYEVCLVHELTKMGITSERQVPLPVVYDDVKLDAGFRIDVLVERRLVVELKAVEALLPVHQAQVLTYLKLTGYRLDLLLNFNVAVLKDGIRRVIL